MLFVDIEKLFLGRFCLHEKGCPVRRTKTVNAITFEIKNLQGA